MDNAAKKAQAQGTAAAQNEAAKKQAEAKKQAASKAPAIPKKPALPKLSGPPAVDSNLKSKLKTDFPDSFATEADFASTKALINASQGLRLRMDRRKLDMTLSFIPISKKGGLLKPGILTSTFKTASKELIVYSTLTGKPFLTFKHDAKNKCWNVTNNEASDAAAGTVKTTQNAETRTISFAVGNLDVGSISFKCPVQKTGMCSSHKPCNLNRINLSGKFKNTSLEENPNAEACKDDLEVNAYYPNGIDNNEVLALLSVFQVAFLELK